MRRSVKRKGASATTRKKSRRGSRPERDIQKEILEWLGTTDLVHWRQNSGMAFLGPRRIILGPAGLPDIVVIIRPHGRFVGLEVKNDKGRLRPKQIEFAKKLTEAGGLYFVVRSVEQAKRAVAEAVGT